MRLGLFKKVDQCRDGVDHERPPLKLRAWFWVSNGGRGPCQRCGKAMNWNLTSEETARMLNNPGDMPPGDSTWPK